MEYTAEIRPFWQRLDIVQKKKLLISYQSNLRTAKTTKGNLFLEVDNFLL